MRGQRFLLRNALDTELVGAGRRRCSTSRYARGISRRNGTSWIGLDTRRRANGYLLHGTAQTFKSRTPTNCIHAHVAGPTAGSHPLESCASAERMTCRRWRNQRTVPGMAGTMGWHEMFEPTPFQTTNRNSPQDAAHQVAIVFAGQHAPSRKTSYESLLPACGRDCKQEARAKLVLDSDAPLGQEDDASRSHNVSCLHVVFYGVPCFIKVNAPPDSTRAVSLVRVCPLARPQSPC